MQPETSRLQSFVASLLAREGAIVEAIEPEGLQVMAPPPVQAALALPDFAVLGFGATLPPGARRIGLENDWLERFQQLIGDRGRWTCQVLRPENRPPADPERSLAHDLVLENATYRLLGVAPAWTRYRVFTFRFVAMSDEKREGLLQIGVNLATGAMPDAMPRQILAWHDAEGAAPAITDLPPDLAGMDLADADWAYPDRDRSRLLDLIAMALPVRLDAALAPFMKGLHRRLGRDQDRLHAYHDGLYGEAARRLSLLPEDDPARSREEQRIAAIKHDYRAKLDDLGRQYALRVSVTWVQTLDLVMPVHRLDVQIRRRKAQRLIQLDWNPLVRRLESPPCEDSFAPEPPRLVCDDALHLVSPVGLAACDSCARPFCRACHRKACPKCGHAVPGSGFSV